MEATIPTRIMRQQEALRKVEQCAHALVNAHPIFAVGRPNLSSCAEKKCSSCADSCRLFTSSKYCRRCSKTWMA